MKKVLFIGLVSFLLSGCSYVDNWLLGKDNMPQPGPLKPIKHPKQLSVRWAEKVKGNRRFSLIDYLRGKYHIESGYFKLAPIYRNGKVYTATSDGHIEALNAKTGQTIWENMLPSGAASGPYVGAKNIAIGGTDASVFVVKRQNGKVLWHEPVANTVLAPPVIDKGRVIAKTIDGHVYAFDEMTGQMLWNYHHQTPNLVLRAQSTPVIVDNSVIVGFADGRLDALSLDNGSVLWQRSIAYPQGSSDVDRMVDIDATPIVKNDVIYAVTYQGYIVALSVSTGRFLWQHTLSSYRNMVLGSRYLYVTDTDSAIWAFNPRTGTVVWRQKALHSRDLTAPVLTRNGLVFADGLGYIHLLSSITGDITGRLSLVKDKINARPAHTRNELYVQTEGGQLYNVTVGGK